MRLDHYLVEHYPQYSRSKLQQLIKDGCVTVQGAVVTTPKLDATDKIIVLTEPAAQPLYPPASKTSLAILFEDDAILVVNKPAGQIVHPTTGTETDTLVQAALRYFPTLKDAIYDPASPVSRQRPGIVHRLDKDTSGCIVIAKTAETLQNLAAQFHARTTEKTYLTLLNGNLGAEQIVDAPIQRKGSNDKNRMVASHDKSQGREAYSVFTPLKYDATNNVTLVAVQIKTGRTHQIRVHAKFIGHPVMGDSLYTNKPARQISEKLGIEHQLLHAWKLSFNHPVSGERLQFECTPSSHYLTL